MSRTALACCLLLALAPTMPASAAPPAPSATPEAEWRAWQERRLKNLRKEDGWLALVGLHWLEAGENRVPGLPGRFVLEAGAVRLEAAPGDGWTLQGQGVTSRVLASDAAGAADRLKRGTVQAQVIERSGKLALRVWDAASPARAGFQGLELFPYDPRYRLVARFERYDPPKEVETPSVVNLPQKELVPGRVRFTLEGKEYTLEPVVEKGETDLFFVFKDLTARKETYGAGRFLYASPPKDGTVLLDFNRAYNPPCVFTTHATCPLPRPENLLPVRIEAGEKRWAGH